MDPFALEGLAMALVRKGRIDEAAGHLCTAVRLRPDDAEARFNLGSAPMHLGRFDLAAQELRAADRIRPGDVDIVYSLGVALANTHRIDEAVQSFKAAIALRPDAGVAHRDLAKALYLRGDFAEASRELGLGERYGAPCPELAKALSAGIRDH